MTAHAPSIHPKTFLMYDSSNELYPYLIPGTWRGSRIPKTFNVDTENYRCIIYSVLDCLLFLDYQFRYQFAECSESVYDMSDVRITEIYRFDRFHQVLSYRVFPVVDTVNKGFYCFTSYNDLGFRPLFKEYELFLIDRMLLDPSIMKKEYYRTSFLLAVQRTCYLWLINIAPKFEMRGSCCMPIRWAHSKEEKKHYDLFTAMIHMEFDMSECFRCDQPVLTALIDIKLSAPFNFERSKVDRDRFDSDQEFYDELWDLRFREVKKTLKTTLKSLKCDEDISDIQ